MITADDLLSLPYTPDLTQAGIACACRALLRAADRRAISALPRLRQVVAESAVELAFRRHLGKEGIPFHTLAGAPFTDPDRYDVALGGRRCEIHSLAIFAEPKAPPRRGDPDALLNLQARVPIDQLTGEYVNDGDVLIFAFVDAQVIWRWDELQQAIAGEQPVYPIYPFSEAWAQPDPGRSLGQVILKSNLPAPATVMLSGQNRERGLVIEEIALPPGAYQQTTQEYIALGYLHIAQVPAGRVEIHCRGLPQALILWPEEWENIWICGREIILAGYMTRGELRRRSRELPANRRDLQYPRNAYLPIRSLRPLADLFTRTQEWEKRRKRQG